MGIVEKKLRRLFDYQKFEQEPGLKSVIDGVEGKTSGIRKLTEDELELTAGGRGAAGPTKDDPQTNGRCKATKDCSSYLQKTMDGYICPDCGALYDKDRRLVSRGSKGVVSKLY